MRLAALIVCSVEGGKLTAYGLCVRGHAVADTVVGVRWVGVGWVLRVVVDRVVAVGDGSGRGDIVDER